MKLLKKILKNPISIWLKRLYVNLCLEYKYRKHKLVIGYMASISKTKFSFNNFIGEKTFLHDVSIGDYSYIAKDSIVNKSIIGKFCSIGDNCKINLSNHPTNFVSTHPIFYSTSPPNKVKFSNVKLFNTEYNSLIIENDVWIGSNSIILGGIRIGNGVIVASGSVVTKDLPPYSIAAGVPAKIIKFRFN